MRVGGIVLCGGKSSRMGRPKAWLPVGGELLLPRVVRVVGEVVSPVVVVAAAGQDLPPLPAEVVVVRDELPDRGPLQGLLAGLEHFKETADVVFVSACDAPRLRVEFVHALIEKLEAADSSFPPSPGSAGERVGVRGPSLHPDKDGLGTPGAFPPHPDPLPRKVGGEGEHSPPPLAGDSVIVAAAVPDVGGHLHPLTAAYRVTPTLAAVRQLLASGRSAVRDLVPLLRTRAVGGDELRTVDPDLDSLRTANTPAEFAQLAPPSGENAGGRS